MVRCLVIGGESGAMGASALRAAPGPGQLIAGSCGVVLQHQWLSSDRFELSAARQGGRGVPAA